MRIIFVTLIFCFSFSIIGFAQNLQNRQWKCGSSDDCPNNTLLHETNGNISKLNYNTLKFDHIIKCGATNMRSIAFGLTYYTFPKVRAIGAPFEFNMMFGMGNALIETGLGIQYLFFYKNYSKDPAVTADNNISYLAASGRLGLRIQKDRGFFFRAGFTPILSLMNHDKIPILGAHKFKPMAGIGIGYTFPSR